MIGLEESQLQGLPNNVIGLQRTANQQELAEYYSAADVFINPTYQDSLPTVNMEALACGTPVITIEQVDPLKYWTRKPVGLLIKVM